MPTLTPKEPDTAKLTTTDKEDIVSVGDIADAPQVFDDTEVIVVGEVEAWVTKQAFILEVQDLSIANKGIIVFSEQPFSPPQDTTDAQLGLGDSAIVEVTGTVRELTEQELRDTLGPDLDENEFLKYDDMPILFVRSLDVIEQ